MCNSCKYGRGHIDDRVCCDQCYLNRKSYIVFYQDPNVTSSFLCDSCTKFYYDRKFHQMLNIDRIVTLE